MGLTVSSAAGDVYLSQGWSQTAGTGSTYTVTGPGRVTLQNDSNITSGRLVLSSSVPFTVRANLATTGTATIGAGSTLRLAGAAGRLSAGSHSAAIVNSGSLVYASASNQTLSGVISGAGSLGLAGDGVVTTGSLTLSGANTFSGATRLTAGSLLLNYNTQDNSKLSDTAALSLGNAAIALAGGSHAETVLSTSLTAGAATISRSSGNATLNLNAITRATGATLNLGAASIATTDSTNTSGILGGWATVAGADWAVNSTNAADGAITALASYTADTWSAGNNTNVTGGGSVDSATTNSLRFATASALTLSGVNTVSSGGILVASGGGGGSLTGGSLRTTSGGDLVVHQYDTGADFTIGSQLVDNGSPTMLVKTGPGTLVLSSSNAHTGGTQLNSGTLAFAAGGLGSSGTVGFAGNAALRWQTGNTDDISGRLALSNGATATLDTNGNNVSLGSGFGGTGGLVKAGAGTLTLSGSNTFSGLTTISAGTLALENSFGLGGSTLNTSGTGQLSFGSLTAATLGGLTGTSNLALTNASGQAVALSVGADNTPTNTYSGVLEGLGSFTKTGYGRLALTGPNRYVGSTTISNGYVQLSGGANRLPVGTNLSFANQAGAILDLNGQVQTIGSLTGGGASGGHVWVNGGTLFVGNATSGTYAGSFIDGGSIVKQGTGTLAVSGASTFGGTLRVDEGSVRMEGENRLGLFFNVVTGSAGTLDLNGFSAMVGSLIGSGTVSMKDGTGALTVRSQSNARNEFSGRLTGFGALIKEAGSNALPGRLTLTNSANDYSGGTQLAGGVLEFASGALGTTGQITVTTDPYIGATTRLRWLSGNTDDISSRLVVIPGTTGVLDTNDNNVSFASGLGDGRPTSFAKLGTGTLTLSGSNSYTGGMSLNAGTLLVDAASASAPATNPLSDASRLGFNSGSMLLRGKASGATNQSLQMVAVNGGGGSLLVDPNGGSGVTLNLGTITATNPGSAFVLGNRPGTTGGVSITTTSGTDAQGIYGGRVVYADGSTTGYDWATAASTAGDVRTLGAFSGYATLATTAGTDTSNSRITASTTLGGSRTTNSLKVAPASASQSLSIGASQTLTLTSGGLLATGTDAFTISAGTLAGGNGSGAYDLVIHQYNTGGLTISSVIGNNSSNATNLTKAGPGSLTLSGANTHTGGTRLTSGTLVINNATALGTSVSRFTIDPGTTIDNTSGAAASSLTLSSNNPQTWNGNFTYLGTGGRSLNMGTGSISLDNDVNLAISSGTLTVGGISGGIYGLTKSGAGTLNLSNFTQSLGGPLTVAQGSVITNGAFPNTDIVMANVAGAGITMLNTRSTIQSLSGGGSSGGNISMADGITIAGNASTTYGGVLSGGGTFIKNGLGTLTLTNASNSFPGDVRVNNGTLAFSAAGALGAATSAIELNQAGASSSGRLAYSANANATLSRPITVSNGLGTVSNLGSGTLTLFGTLTKNGTILRLNQGIFNVSGRITGANANSDLYVDNATVTLSNTNNDYNGPTLVYGGGTLALGASGVIPNGSAVTLGAAAGGSGALTVGGFSDTIASLTTGNDGSTVGISVNAGSTGSLTMGNLTFGGGTDTLALSLTSPSLGRYTLLTYTGVRSGTFDTVTGAGNYNVVYGASSNSTIDLQMKANQASTFTLTPASARVLVGGSTQLSGVLANSSPVNAAALTWSPLSTGSLSASGFNSSLGSTIASGSTSSITAWLAAGNTAGTQTWSITNTDNNAITTVSTATGSIAVVNQRNYSPSPSPISLGRFLITGAAAGSTTISSTGSFATTESGTLGTSATSNGLTLSFNNSGSRVFDGSASPQSAGYSVSGNWSGSAGAVSGTFGLAATNELSGGSTVDVAYTGNAVNQRTFSLSNSGTISLGNFLRTASMTGSTTISSSGLNATTANASLGSFGGTNTNGFTLSTNDSTTFNGAESQTANYSLGGSASSAGVINGSFSSTVSAELGSIDPVTVSLVGTAYDAASISKVQTGNVGNGDTISITNAAGSYRSAAYVASTTLTGPGWSVTGFGTGSSAAAGATLAGTAHFDGTGLLSGTYTGLFSATFENNQNYAGAEAGDLGSLSWNLYQTYVNTSGSGSTNLAAGTALSTVSLVSGTGANATVASFAAGSTGLSAADVAMSFTSGSSGLYSNILNLEGTNGLAQVLQLTYDPSLLGGTSEDSLVLAWFDPSKSDWVNSVLGNIGTNPIDWATGFAGSWSQYVASTSGLATAANSLGAFGVDKANKTVWAAINHNSQFAVTVIVPEPGALALAGIGIAAAAYAYRRRRS